MKTFNFVGFVKNLNWNAKILVVGLSLLSGPFGNALAEDEEHSLKRTETEFFRERPDPEWYSITAYPASSGIPTFEDLTLLPSIPRYNRHDNPRELVAEFEQAIRDFGDSSLKEGSTPKPPSWTSLLEAKVFSAEEIRQIYILDRFASALAKVGQASTELELERLEEINQLKDQTRAELSALDEAFFKSKALTQLQSTLKKLDFARALNWEVQRTTIEIAAKRNQVLAALAYYQGLGAGRLEAKREVEALLVELRRAQAQIQERGVSTVNAEQTHEIQSNEGKSAEFR